MGATKRLRPAKKNDELLKGIFEDNFTDQGSSGAEVILQILFAK